MPGFLSVLIIGLAVLATIAFVVMRANKLTVLHIPFAELHVSDESEVLGEGLYGKVLRGEYRGTQVAVKRMLPRHSSRYHSLLSVGLSVCLAGWLAGWLAVCLCLCLLMCPPVYLLKHMRRELWGGGWEGTVFVFCCSQKVCCPYAPQRNFAGSFPSRLCMLLHVVLT